MRATHVSTVTGNNMTNAEWCECLFVKRDGHGYVVDRDVNMIENIFYFRFFWGGRRWTEGEG